MLNDSQAALEDFTASQRAGSAFGLLPHSLRVFFAVDLILLAIAGVTEFICRVILHLGFPYRSPLLAEHFFDLVNLWPRFQYFHTLRFFTDKTDAPCMYPAPVAVLYRIFYSFIPHDLGVFLAFVVLSFLVAAFLFARMLMRRGLAPRATLFLISVAFLTSYPLWFVLKQANMEICVWVLLTVGVWSLLADRGYSAAACFGLAGAMKIFPFIYLGLLLARRQYRQMLFSFFVAVVATLASLWLVYPHILESWRLTQQAVASFRTIVMLHTFPQSGFDHSIFGLIKASLHPLPPPEQLTHGLSAYMAVAAVGGLALYILRIRKLPVINQVLCLCIASILLPPTSFDYTLMHLYSPWALLVLFAIQPLHWDEHVPGLVAAFVCFAVLFVPETEFILHQQSYGGQIKALALIALFLIGLVYPFQCNPAQAARHPSL